MVEGWRWAARRAPEASQVAQRRMPASVGGVDVDVLVASRSPTEGSRGRRVVSDALMDGLLQRIKGRVGISAGVLTDGVVGAVHCIVQQGDASPPASRTGHGRRVRHKEEMQPCGDGGQVEV